MAAVSVFLVMLGICKEIALKVVWWAKYSWVISANAGKGTKGNLMAFAIWSQEIVKLVIDTILQPSNVF